MKGHSAPRYLPLLLAWICLVTAVACEPGGPPEGAPDVSQARDRWLAAAGPVTAWPRPIPMRTQRAEDDDLLVTLLGEVDTPLAEGLYDPVADRVTLNDGTVMEDYFGDSLAIPYYEPMEKTVFPLPPSGWCSWYYYYREVTPEEVLANARWMSENLLDYGARYVQIDDGWQARGGDEGSWRDWTGLDPDFQEMGMDGLAREIRSLGLEAGIWLAPHGQSNREAALASEAFLWTPEGNSVSSWVGGYLVDPTSPAMEGYQTELFQKLLTWGFTYFKVDGQTVVLREYARSQELMAGPIPEGDSDEVAAQLFRRTLAPIRETIGPDSYLLSSWGTAVPGVGIFDGARTGGDVVLGKRGFLTGIRGTQRWAFLHNIAWYSDPDVLLIRPPMTDGLARSWATQIALTGQSLMANDRLPDLPPSRVAMLKKVFPATDIRTLELYQPRNTRKSVLDLKVSHLGRRYDVVGVFNYDDEPQLSRHVRWGDLGLDPAQAYHVFDFWSGVYLGAWKGGVFVDVPGTDVAVLTLVPASSQPVLVSTDRHITQGWVDLKSVTPGEAGAAPSLTGRSRVIGGERYTLTVGYPPGGRGMRLSTLSVRGESEPVEVSHQDHLGYATIRVQSDRTQEVSWEMTFQEEESWRYPLRRPEELQASADDEGNVRVRWTAEYYSIAGYQVEVDGVPVGVAFEPRATLTTLEPGRTYTLGVREVWYDGTVGDGVREITYTVPD